MPQQHSGGETGCASENLQHPKPHAARAARPWGPPGHPPRVVSIGEAGVLHRVRSQVWLGVAPWPRQDRARPAACRREAPASEELVYCTFQKDS